MQKTWSLVGALTLLALIGCQRTPRPPTATPRPPTQTPVAATPTPLPLNNRRSAPTPTLIAPEVPRITIDELYALLSSVQTVLVIDTREPDAYEPSHIPGAINVPYDQVEIVAPQLPKNAKLVFYCAWPAEQTSAGAAQKLAQMGFTDTSALLGGWVAWVRAGYPVESF